MATTRRRASAAAQQRTALVDGYGWLAFGLLLLGVVIGVLLAWYVVERNVRL